ncbi:hypothetical protein GDO86_015841 [Hymenochirus boettgeri]|uniref:Protein FAM161B n=1 Tax=Hymenochirus boettgeri TaxID=247094 RepID=A0A8T2K0H6_9PIPI|nr:hypothetical protein GDO86_015841 [Hymenochirus boettgeri]
MRLCVVAIGQGCNSQHTDSMDWEDEVNGTANLFSRVAKLMDYMDNEEVEYEQDSQAKLQEHKFHYIHELNKPNKSNKPFKHVDESINYFKNLGQNSSKSKGANINQGFLVTVPKPFQMSLREIERKDKMKLRSLSVSLDAENEEDSECLKQFRAQSVPAEVFLPLYNELMEQNDAKRKSHILKRKEFLLSTQKPFSFIAKEEERKKKNVQNYETAVPVKENHKKGNTYKAILDPLISDKLKETELLRKMNSQMRAKDMLQNSAAPIPLSRGVRDSSISLKTQQEYLGFLQQNLTFQPRTNATIPDFQKLYRVFQKESMKNQKEKEPTRNKPFTLHTANRSKLRKKGLVNSESYSDYKEPRKCSSVDLSSLSPNTLPIYITDSTKRRESAIRSSLEEKYYQENQKAHWLNKHKKKTQAMQGSIYKRAKALDPHQSLADTIKEKVTHNRQSDLKRLKEYKEEVEEMKRRVSQRPYLFETITKGNAVKEVERKFISTLQEAGITEEFVQHKAGSLENSEEQESSWEEE